MLSPDVSADLSWNQLQSALVPNTVTGRSLPSFAEILRQDDIVMSCRTAFRRISVTRSVTVLFFVLVAGHKREGRLCRIIDYKEFQCESDGSHVLLRIGIPGKKVVHPAGHGRRRVVLTSATKLSEYACITVTGRYTVHHKRLQVSCKVILFRIEYAVQNTVGMFGINRNRIESQLQVDIETLRSYIFDKIERFLIKLHVVYKIDRFFGKTEAIVIVFRGTGQKIVYLSVDRHRTVFVKKLHLSEFNQRNGLYLYSSVMHLRCSLSQSFCIHSCLRKKRKIFPKPGFVDHVSVHDELFSPSLGEGLAHNIEAG